MLSNRVQSIRPSPTLAVSAKAESLKAEGKPIINLGVGEPDFDTPDFIKEAAIKAIHDGKTKYTAVEGTLELRKAISNKFLNDNNLHYDTNQIIVSNGGKQCFFNLAEALLNPSDEVIIPAPYWVSFPDMVLISEAKPIFIASDLKQKFKISPEQLEKAITKKTKLVVLNSPSNPSGMAYSEKELKALGEVLRAHPDIWIASDDMYEHIFWGQSPFSNIVMANPDFYERTIILHGVSKTYAMTGWRIGFAAAPATLIKAMKIIQSQSTSNAGSISQAAATAALTGSKDCIKNMVHAFKERHDFLVKGLNDIPGFQCEPSDGTFYAFPRVQDAIDNLPEDIKDDQSLAEFLLQEAYVATVPGSAFGSPGFLRFSFATSIENLRESVNRLKKIFKT